MNIAIRRVEHADIESMRDLYREEANCQIIHDSIVRRQMADPYLIQIDGRTAGYGAVWNKHDPGQVMEFYTLPLYRASARGMYRELLAASAAKTIEAQTNMPLMLTMLYDFATNIIVRNILFEDAATTALVCRGAAFRRNDPDNDYLVEIDGATVATGGFLCHYNPPYGDIYMEVKPEARGKGYGSYIVQELKRVCYEAGRKPAARCNPGNFASRRTLEKAGLLPCGRMLAGDVASDG